MSIKAVFGANIKYYRKQMRLSQEQLSEKLDITPKHLSTIETGDVFVSVDLLERMTRTLGISASALFYTPEEKSLDDSFLTNVDRVLEEELVRAIAAIKLRLRRHE
jgi:transcriptional regulator with XRE-family HTH domain